MRASNDRRPVYTIFMPKIEDTGSSRRKRRNAREPLYRNGTNSRTRSTASDGKNEPTLPEQAFWRCASMSERRSAQVFE